VSTNPQLFVVPFNEVEKHLPVDQGSGAWEQTRVRYSSFLSFRCV
jgi:hypothetical protein